MAFSHLIDAIEHGSGKFDLHKSYFVNNPTKDDIEVKWSAMQPEERGAGTYVIKAGERGGPYPQFLAYHIVKALVNREMQRDGKARFFGSAEMRKPYEDKFLIEVDQESNEDPAIAEMRYNEEKKEKAEMEREAISEGPYTSSETRRKRLKKKSATDEFEGTNRE